MLRGEHLGQNWGVTTPTMRRAHLGQPDHPQGALRQRPPITCKRTHSPMPKDQGRGNSLCRGDLRCQWT